MSKSPHISINPGQSAKPAGPQASEVMTAKGEVIVTDSTGRNLTLAEPEFFAQFELARSLGQDSANVGYTTMVMPLLYLSAIGEEIVPMPSNHIQVKALVKRLGKEGYQTLIEGIAKHFVTTGENQNEEKQALKNS